MTVCVCVLVWWPCADPELNVSLAIIAGCSRSSLQSFSVIDHLIMINIIHINSINAPVPSFSTVSSPQPSHFLSLHIFHFFTVRVLFPNSQSGHLLSDALSFLIYLLSAEFKAFDGNLVHLFVFLQLPLKAFSSSNCLSDCLFFSVWSGQTKETLTLSEETRKSEMLGFISICFICPAALI